MPKKEKIIAVALLSREAMKSTVADIVRLKLEHAQKTAAMEAEIAEVQKRHQEGLLEVARQIESKEASVYTYCQRNRGELFPEKKSIDMLLAEVGFELTPHRVEKKAGKDTWSTIARRLQSLDWAGKYVRESDPEVDKHALLKDRTELTPTQLAEAGIKFEQDENFFIRPKSQVASDTVRQEAA
jgi:phage host-nuclease inhibitor protein Gam